KVGRLVQAESFDKVDQKLWTEFSPPLMGRPEDEERRRFEALRTYFTAGMDSNRFDEAVKRALAPLESNGLLKGLKHKPDEGSQVAILVYQIDRPPLTAGNLLSGKGETRSASASAERRWIPDRLRRVAVDEVRIDKAKGALRQRLDSDLKIQGSMIDNATV